LMKGSFVPSFLEREVMFYVALTDFSAKLV
jgi:hypothetical protein